MTDEKEIFSDLTPGEESVWELIGEVVTYLSTDFTRVEEVKRRTVEEVILYSLFDIDYAEETEFTLPSGEDFSVIGTSDENGMYLVSYKDEIFACEKDDIEYSSVEVTE